MRRFAAALALALLGAAQTPVPSAAPAGSPPPDACSPATSLLGGVGRALVVPLTAGGERVCATVADLAGDEVRARFVTPDAADPSALVDAAADGGSGGLVTPGPLGVDAVPAAVGANAGPFLIEPGGAIGDVGADVTPKRLVVLAFAGPRLLVIGLTPVTLADAARALRDHPDLFGAESIERALVLAGGPAAGLHVAADDGAFGALPERAPRLLEFARR